MSRRVSELLHGKQDPGYHSSYAQYPRGETHAHLVQPHAVTSTHSMPVLELKVPMCCEKCVEKVKESIEELQGVRSVVCDQFNQRVTVTGPVDPGRLLKRVKRVKKKSEFFSMGSYIDNASHTRAPGVVSTQFAGNRAPGVVSTQFAGNRAPGVVSTQFAGNRAPALVSSHYTANRVPSVVSTQYAGRELVRSNSYGRTHGGGLTRSNSFGRQLGRQPSFGKHALYDSRPQEYERESFGIRRMPSFKKHRYHDAEYMSMDNQYTPAYGEPRYVSHHSHRPGFQSQVSFSKLPVTNPYYMKHIDSEY